jgi:molybdenum cofactor biosynthesis enzyme MoaA
LKDHKTFSFETLRQNLDTLFNKVDYIQRINIIGGEAMLHPKLPMIIQHILHYRDKIGYILIITNGTIIPTEELLSVLRDGGKKTLYVSSLTLTRRSYPLVMQRRSGKLFMSAV